MSNRRNSGRNRNPNIVANEFGLLLEKLRLSESGLTQPDLAIAVGVEKSSISFYESGKSFPKRAVAEKISERLKSRELMTAWYKVNEQREKEKKERRLAKERQEVTHMPPVSPTTQRLIAAMQRDGHLSIESPEAQHKLGLLIDEFAPAFEKEERRRAKKGKK